MNELLSDSKTHRIIIYTMFFGVVLLLIVIAATAVFNVDVAQLAGAIFGTSAITGNGASAYRSVHVDAPIRQAMAEQALAGAPPPPEGVS